MSQPIVPQVDMLSTLLMIEKRPISRLDNALLGTVAKACQTISPQITTALKEVQRGLFRDLCVSLPEEDIDRAVQILPVSASVWFNIKFLIILSIELSAGTRRAVSRVREYRRRIGTGSRPVSHAGIRRAKSRHRASSAQLHGKATGSRQG